MTARDDLFAAAHALAELGHTTFSLNQIVKEAIERGSTYAESTLRTNVVHYLRADEDRTGDGLGFIKVERGRYRLGVKGSVPGASDPPATAAVAPPPVDPVVGLNGEWFLESNLQASVVRMLASDGWDILLWPAPTAVSTASTLRPERVQIVCSSK